MLKKTALSIAGTDPIGGAGIQADLKTMTLNGVYAMSAVTALVAQNTLGVYAVQEASPSFLCQQLDAVFEDIRPDSVKIGMVSSTALIEVIAERLRFYHAENIVVDPVMVATAGSALIQSDAVQAMTAQLFPLAALITPNIPEAEVLSGRTIRTPDEMEQAAAQLQRTFGCAVLLKGGHNVNDANDLLVDRTGRAVWLCGQRIQTSNTHGTGCTLSSAIAANLAKGFPLPQAVARAKEYLTAALSVGLDLGHGSGPLDHALTGCDPVRWLCPAADLAT